MAVEDIPPRPRRGLGEKLADVLARQTEGRFRVYEETLFGVYEEPSFEDGTTITYEDVLTEARRYETGAEPSPLPKPEYLDYIAQATTGIKKTSRPDRRPEDQYYNEGPNNSTRVHAMQWIPTYLSDSSIAYEDGIIQESSVYGDILVAFARPSNNQLVGAGSLYVYENHSGTSWESFKISSSLGRAVNTILGAGRPYKNVDGSRYRMLHATTMDGGAPYDNWIFNEDQLARWRTIRPGNSKL